MSFQMNNHLHGKTFQHEFHKDLLWGHYFFLDFINALRDGVRLLCKTFADDIPLYGKP